MATRFENNQVIPECSVLPTALCLGRDHPRDRFIARIIPDHQESWQVIGHCRDCGQMWLVEEPDTRSGGLAIKIPDLAAWTAADERAARIGYLRRLRGGDAPSGQGMVAGCDRRPLAGIAYCAEHDFEFHGTQC